MKFAIYCTMSLLIGTSAFAKTYSCSGQYDGGAGKRIIQTVFSSSSHGLLFKDPIYPKGLQTSKIPHAQIIEGASREQAHSASVCDDGMKVFMLGQNHGILRMGKIEGVDQAIGCVFINLNCRTQDSHADFLDTIETSAEKSPSGWGSTGL